MLRPNCLFRNAAQEFHYLPLGPAPVVAIGGGEERAVSAVARLTESEMRIARDLGARVGKDLDEWVAGRVQNQARHCDTLDCVRRGCARIVVRGSRETAVVGSDLVVEFAQAAPALQAAGVKVIRKQF